MEPEHKASQRIQWVATNLGSKSLQYSKLLLFVNHCLLCRGLDKALVESKDILDRRIGSWISNLASKLPVAWLSDPGGQISVGWERTIYITPASELLVDEVPKTVTVT